MKNSLHRTRIFEKSKYGHLQCIAVCLMGAVFSLFASRCIAGSPDTFNHYFKLLPRPQKVEMLEGKGLLYSTLYQMHLENTDRLPVLSGLCTGLPLGEERTKGTLSLVIRKDMNLPSPEGYKLEISNGQVVIEAVEGAGLFYGIQTLNQLLGDSRDQQIEIPACRITDFPKIACRAVHIDLKHHLDAGYYYYHIIDNLSAIKINTIIIEFEDKLRYKKAKEVGAANAISVEEFAAISKYAKERYIEISPLVQGLGHASFILKHDAYKDLRDDPASDWVFDPLNPKTYELQFSLYEDAMAATPYGKYLHVGGDEVGELGKSVLSRQSGKKPIELQMYWLKKVTDFANQHNRIPVFWDDMVFKLAGLYRTTYDSTISERQVNELWKKNRSSLDENIPIFPRNCIYMRWNYETPKLPGNQLAIDWYKSHNLDVMPATAAQQSYAMLQRNKSNFQSIKDFCQLTAAKHLKGILCTIWDDSSPHFETVWRGLHDFAWFSWNDAEVAEPVVHSTFRHRFFSPALANDAYEFQNMLEEAITFWETAFLSEGDRENYHSSFHLLPMPDPAKSGAWSLKYKDKLDQAKKEIARYREIKTRIGESLLLARRNRYALEVMDQINELQAYSPDLLLLLARFDAAASKEEKKDQMILIGKKLDEFPVIRNRLEKVYAETRMMGNPPGYKLDANLHAHLANATNNMDWMYVYELAMNKKVSEWLLDLRSD